MWGRRKESLVHTVRACARFPWYPAYYSATLKLPSISAYLLKAAMHSYTPCGTHMSSFEVKNNIAWTVTVCIASFEVIGELQRERLHQSRAKPLGWNGRMQGQFLQAKSRVTSSLPHHRPHTLYSVAGSFYTREVGVLAKVSLTEQVLWDISKFSDILG